jgi:hypothetical protein
MRVTPCDLLAEQHAMNKPSRARPVSDAARHYLAATFRRQGFASTELVTRWPDIVGDEIAAHCEPMRMQWSRRQDVEAPDPATLVLRVDGPVALEIQHLSGVILERVNRFFGWRAIGRIAIRQAPLARRPARLRPSPPDAAATAREAAALADIGDEGLRDALARLAAAVKRT